MDSKSHKTVKGEYIRCEKLDSDGNCTIHSRRKNYPGYRESCIEYTCGNVGPLLSQWMIKNNISLEKDVYIGGLMRIMYRFVTTGNCYNHRYMFLRDYVLIKCTNSIQLIEFLTQPWVDLNYEFNKWALDNPEDPEFDRLLREKFEIK